MYITSGLLLACAVMSWIVFLDVQFRRHRRAPPRAALLVLTGAFKADWASASISSPPSCWWW
jgi:hypothetical protein